VRLDFLAVSIFGGKILYSLIISSDRMAHFGDTALDRINNLQSGYTFFSVASLSAAIGYFRDKLGQVIDTQAKTGK